MTPDGKISFQGDSRPVPTVAPEIYRDEKTFERCIEEARDEGRDEATRLIFKILLEGDADATESGLRGHLLAWKSGCHPALPKNQSDLAKATGLSQSSVSKGITAQCNKSPDFAGAFLRATTPTE
jgi:hypothetical protein